MAVVWKDVKDYEGLYKVSEYGDVWSVRSEIILKTATGTTEYKRVTFSKKGKHKHYPIHRLVAENFIDNIYNKSCVNHIDENKENNHYSNLEWCTHKENNNHGTRNQRIMNSRETSLAWKEFQIKRTKKVSVPIIGINLVDGEIIEFASSNEAGRNGFYQGAISRCLNGKQKTHKNYKWIYKNIYI